MNKKAKKIEAFHDKFFTCVVYEYRGKRYEVTYPNGWQVCCTPAWVQHRDEQEKIDAMLDSPVNTQEDESNGNTFAEQLDEIWNMLGWD